MTDGVPPPADLSTASTQQLFGELCKRHKGVLLAMTLDSVPDVEANRVWFGGGLVQAMGLAHYAVMFLDCGAFGALRRKPIGPDADEP